MIGPGWVSEQLAQRDKDLKAARTRIAKLEAVLRNIYTWNASGDYERDLFRMKDWAGGAIAPAEENEYSVKVHRDQPSHKDAEIERLHRVYEIDMRRAADEIERLRKEECKCHERNLDLLRQFDEDAARIAKLEAQNKRLMSRGIEDMHDEIQRLRRSLDNIKIRAYELGQPELHDMALKALTDSPTKE